MDTPRTFFVSANFASESKTPVVAIPVLRSFTIQQKGVDFDERNSYPIHWYVKERFDRGCLTGVVETVYARN